VISDVETTYGVTSNVARLRRVLVRTPATTGDFAGAGWRQPEPALLLRQHAAFCELLAGLGCDVVTAPPVEGLVDACYMYDSAFTIGDGAIVLRSAKPARQGEYYLEVKREGYVNAAFEQHGSGSREAAGGRLPIMNCGSQCQR